MKVYVRHRILQGATALGLGTAEIPVEKQLIHAQIGTQVVKAFIPKTQPRILE
jgi:hypothetical protein